MYRKIFYDKYLSSVNVSEDEMETHFSQNIILQDKIVENLPENIDSRIIDLGCGYGTFLNALKSRGYKNLYGIEIGEEQKNFLNSKGLKVFQKDIINFLKEENEKYDFISLFDVLEHFTKNEIAEIIPMLKNKLNSQGKLIIRVPNGEAIFKGSIMYGDFTHETFFTKRSLIQIFKTFDFSDINVYPVIMFGNSWKSKIAKLLYFTYVKLYKIFLMIDNPSSIEYFVPTQNILAIVKK